MPSVASVIQGEASGYQGQLAVASVIQNRARAWGLTPYQVVNQAGQFTGSATPTTLSNGFASMLENGSLPSDPTNGALYYVSRAPGASWGGVLGATGPATAGILGGGVNIGGNFFSDRWGTPSQGWLGGVSTTGAQTPFNPDTTATGSQYQFSVQPFDQSGSTGLPTFAQPGGGAGTTGTSIGTPDQQDASGAGLPMFTQPAVQQQTGGILSGMWEPMGVTAVTAAAKTQADAVKKASEAATKASAASDKQNQADTQQQTTTASNIFSAFFSNIYDMFVRGGVLVFGLVLVAGALYLMYQNPGALQSAGRRAAGAVS